MEVFRKGRRGRCHKKEEKEDVTRKGRSRRWNWERKKREFHKKEEEEDVMRKGRSGRCD